VQDIALRDPSSLAVEHRRPQVRVDAAHGNGDLAAAEVSHEPMPLLVDFDPARCTVIHVGVLLGAGSPLIVVVPRPRLGPLHLQVRDALLGVEREERLWLRERGAAPLFCGGGGEVAGRGEELAWLRLTEGQHAGPATSPQYDQEERRAGSRSAHLGPSRARNSLGATLFCKGKPVKRRKATASLTSMLAWARARVPLTAMRSRAAAMAAVPAARRGAYSGFGARGESPFRFYVWPWLGALVTAGGTLYSANYMRSDELYKAVVLELGRRDGLRTLQLMVMTFGGRWTEEVRGKLALNGCIESLIPMQAKLNAELKEAAEKLEQVCLSCEGCAWRWCRLQRC